MEFRLRPLGFMEFFYKTTIIDKTPQSDLVTTNTVIYIYIYIYIYIERERERERERESKTIAIWS